MTDAEAMEAIKFPMKPLPHCCGLPMVDDVDRFYCQRLGCPRVVWMQDWLDAAWTQTRPWMPTVPHPLVEMDKELQNL